MARMPWFRFFPAHFMSDPAVQLLTWDQRGRYFWALCCSALTDTPGMAPEADWAAWMGYDEASWASSRAALARCFKVSSAGWVQSRLRSEYAEGAAFHADASRYASAGGRARIAGMDAGMRSELAKRAAAARWGKTMPAHASGMPAVMPAMPAHTHTHKNLPSKTESYLGSQVSRQSESIPTPARTSVPEGAAPVPVIELPLRDGTLFPVYQHQVERWQRTFPDVAILATLREMVAWLDANPTRRKTRRGAARFVTGWLLREQNRPDNPTGATRNGTSR